MFYIQDVISTKLKDVRNSSNFFVNYSQRDFSVVTTGCVDGDT